MLVYFRARVFVCLGAKGKWAWAGSVYACVRACACVRPCECMCIRVRVRVRAIPGVKRGIEFRGRYAEAKSTFRVLDWRHSARPRSRVKRVIDSSITNLIVLSTVFTLPQRMAELLRACGEPRYRGRLRVLLARVVAITARWICDSHRERLPQSGLARFPPFVLLRAEPRFVKCKRQRCRLEECIQRFNTYLHVGHIELDESRLNLLRRY